MANVQTHFNKFHDIIKTSYDDNHSLRDKRDLLLRNLQYGLQRLFSHPPSYTTLNQGSYAMFTGIKPLPGEDYDIDIGLFFHISKDTYSPIRVKQWVYEALKFGNRTVEYKRPCVRVQYHRAGEEAYHVDFAVYSEKDYNWDNQIYLAKGLVGSRPEYQIWEVSEPYQLIEISRQKFPNQEGHRNQFRRVIRFLKRWKDYNFSAAGNERPTGIAITACAMNWFQIGTVYNVYDGKSYYDDLKALKNLAGSILNQFDFGNRISVKLPVPPYNDLFAKMTDTQIQNFKIKLVGLIYSLNKAEKELNISSACRILQTVFGNDFPLP